MANEVFKTPDVYVKEIDNTFVADTNNTVFGTGAITLKANQGPVNQRLLFTRFRDFQQTFGKPTSTTDYGHFAARLYMAVAPSLYVVRASYGDESYATIQYPSEEAFSNNKEYIAPLSAGNPYIKLTTTAETNDLINLVKLNLGDIDQDFKDLDNTNYVYTSRGVIANEGVYYDINTQKYAKAVFCEAELDITSGTCLKIPTIDGDIKTVMVASGLTNTPSGSFLASYNPASNSNYGEQLLNLTHIGSNLVTSSQIAKAFSFNKESLQFDGTLEDYKSLLNYTINGTSATLGTTEGNFYSQYKNTLYFPFNFSLDSSATLDGKSKNVDVYLKPSLFNLGNTFSGNYSNLAGQYYTADGVTSYETITEVSPNALPSGGYEKFGISKIKNPHAWESNAYLTDTYVSGTPLVEASRKEVRSIKFVEYGMGDDTNWMVAAYQKAENIPACSGALINAIYESYGTNAIEAKDCTPYIAVRVDGYTSDMENAKLPLFCSAQDFEKRCSDLSTITSPETFGIFNGSDASELKVDLLLIDGDINETTDVCDKLFISYQDANDDKIYTTSVFNISDIEHPTVPVTKDNTNKEIFKKDDRIKDAVAIPTNQALVMYPDGYTKTCDTDEEPGNGDLESIKPWCGSSLVFGAIGPGKYANDLGIAIVTPDQYDIKALNIPNAFDWRWRFDDEDKNKKTKTNDIIAMIKGGTDYKDETKKLTWTQVYKVNVYRKPSDKTAEDAWGTGKEAMVSNIPVESFLVSNDPKMVDGEGKSLYAPNVINAESNFIYVSRKSVQSMGGKLPKATFGIFPLIGGEDGTKSGINQKQAALQLYSDPDKANFDLIFNTDAIESFASREKYKGAQIKFDEIAGSRGEALAIVQATSKEAKKLAKAQAEGKGFSFDYPSFVAMYAGYDKYFDPDLSAYVYLPKSVAAAVTEGWIMYNRNPWDAPAGVENGGIEFTTGNQLLNINADDLGELYSNNINCSRTMPIYGEVLWGNKTAQKKNTALRSINVRVLLNYVKKNVKRILTPYIFKNNTDTTRARMKNQLVNFIGGIEQQGGCTNSRVRVWCSGEDLMNHIVRVEIGFIPPYTIEYIPVNIVLDSAANTIDILEA